MEVADVLNSKVFVKGNSVTFNSPKSYLEPFIDKISSLDPEFDVKVSGAVKNAEEDKTQNIAYGRVCLEAKLSGYGTDDSIGKVGMVYALDTQKPTVKVYTGQEVSACLNLCIFNAEQVYSFDLLGGGMDKAYQMAKQYAEEKEKEVEIYLKYKKELLEREHTVPEIERIIGKLIHEAMETRLGTSPILSAAKELWNEKSRYSIISTGGTTGWNIYNAITDHISHRADILDRPTKTLLLSKMILN